METMKTVFKLKPIQGIDKNGNPFQIYEDTSNYIIPQKKRRYKVGELIREKFIKSFEGLHLKDINEINFIYELHVKIIPDEILNKWNVTNESVLKGDTFFQINCEDENKFLEIFEQKLKKHLYSILYDNPNIIATLSM